MINPRKTILLALLVFALPIAGMHAYIYVLTRAITLPPNRPVEVRFLESQNWTPDERQWFYHETQGGGFEINVPFSWFVNFEQPRIPALILGEVPRLVADDYISRFGFLPNATRSFNPAEVDIDWAAYPGRTTGADERVNNEAQLPVGFARDRGYALPESSSRQEDVIGFTCAACHTGQLNYSKDGVDYGVRIDGGPALVHLTKFELATGIAAGLTLKIPTRFNRFADNVLPEGYTKADKEELRQQLAAFNDAGEQLKAFVDRRRIYSTVDGFGRVDALGKIGNFLFAEEGNLENWAVADAPVSFPPIWDASWFDWVQYNASIKRPMVRNAGEALGVFARVDYTDTDQRRELFESTIRIDNLYEIESLLRGREPFDGLRAPKWPEDIFGGIDRVKAERGAALYAQHCQSCHHPAPVAGSGFYDQTNREIWTAPDSVTGLQYLKLNLVNLYEIGTDPLQAVNFAGRVINVGAVGQMYGDTLGAGNGGLLMFGTALPFVVAETIGRDYELLGLDDSTRFVWNGMRPNEIRAPLAYKARPLDGVWATAPYLHNGSVPNLYQMLSPHDERDRTFYVGDREFDPVGVGYRTNRIKGAFLFDTSIPGNSNYGHLFDGDFDPETVDWDQVKSGTIGPRLTEAERRDIIEFLKTL